MNDMNRIIYKLNNPRLKTEIPKALDARRHKHHKNCRSMFYLAFHATNFAKIDKNDIFRRFFALQFSTEKKLSR